VVENEYTWSIIIPHINDYPEVFFTVFDKVERLRDDYYMDFEVIVVENGSRQPDLRLVRRLMGAYDKNGNPVSEKSEYYWGPPRRFPHRLIEIPHQLHSKPAINVGAYKAKGKYLGIFDSHTLINRGFFKKAEQVFDDHPECAIVHCPISWSCWNPHRRAYQYRLQLDGKFWATFNATKLRDEPYPIAAMGNCAMAIRRDAFLHMRGFPPMLRQYGGGEPYIDLLAWMFGYEVYLHPDMHVYHYSLTPTRGYDRNWMTFFRNVCLSGYIIDGEKRARMLLEQNLEKDVKEHPDWRPIYIQLFEEALNFGRMRRRYVEKNAIYTLDEVLKKFEREKIFY